MFTSVILQQRNIYSTLWADIIWKTVVNWSRRIVHHPLSTVLYLISLGLWLPLCTNSRSKNPHFEKYFLRQGALGYSPSWHEVSTRAPPVPASQHEQGCDSRSLSLALYSGPRQSTCHLASCVTCSSTWTQKKRKNSNHTFLLYYKECLLEHVQLYTEA